LSIVFSLTITKARKLLSRLNSIDKALNYIRSEQHEQQHHKGLALDSTTSNDNNNNISDDDDQLTTTGTGGRQTVF
jgi:hypothetical protein